MPSDSLLAATGLAEMLAAPYRGLTLVDAYAAALMPSWLRLLLWGAVAGAVSMLVYALLSSQKRIVSGRQALREAKRRLNRFDGPLPEALPLMRDMLRLALAQVGRTGWPALVASLPLLLLLHWLSTAYGYVYPAPGTPVQVRLVPGHFEGRWVAAEGTTGGFPSVVVLDHARRLVLDIPLAAPVPELHKRRWWNVLIGNPAGYLPADGPVERIRTGVPRHEHLTFGPHWMRGWEFLFFGSLLTVSVILKKSLRIA